MSDVAHKLTSAEVEAIFDRSLRIGRLGPRVVSLDSRRQDVIGPMGMRELEPRPGSGQHYARLAVGEFPTAVARVRRGSRTGLVDIEVVDDKHELVALGRGTYANTPA